MAVRNSSLHVLGSIGKLATQALVLLASSSVLSAFAQTEIEPEPLDRNMICTYFGHEGGERSQGVWELRFGENAGRILIAGETTSRDFDNVFTPLATPAYPNHADPAISGNSLIANSRDAYVAILSADLSQVVYWTYIGGVGDDRAYFATEDHQGNIWVSGFMSSPADFPITPNQYYWGPTSTTGPGTNPTTDSDVWVAKFDYRLHDRLASTAIGGDDDESPRGTLWVDGEDVYVSGATNSIDFRRTVGPVPTTSTVGPTEHDAFVVKLRRDTAELVWSRMIVGDGDDRAWGNVRVDSSGKIFVGGCTTSSSITFTSGFDAISAPANSLNGPADGFVAKLSDDGSIDAMRHIGGSGTDWVAFNDCLELDGQGRPVLLGLTRSLDFPTTANALSSMHSNDPSNNPPLAHNDASPDSNDVWVAKISSDLSSVVYSTYVNAFPNGAPTTFHREEPAGLALAAGAIYISGETDSARMPMLDISFDDQISTGVAVPNSGPHDCFLIKFSPGINSPSVWQYSTFFGGDTLSIGNADEPGNRGRNVIISDYGDNRGRVIFSGQSTTTDLPTTSGVVFPNLVSTNDLRGGFVAIHNTN